MNALHRLPVMLGVAVAAVGTAACSGDLEPGSSLWKVTIESPVSDSRVPFCPAILMESSVLDGTFEASTDAVTSVFGTEVEDDNQWTVSGLSSATGIDQPSATFAALFSVAASFDIGPIGSVYDDSPPATFSLVQANGLTTPGQSVEVVRTLVGGSKEGDSKVKLSYAYKPTCEKLTVVDAQGVEHSCDCVEQTITYDLDGST